MAELNWIKCNGECPFDKDESRKLLTRWDDGTLEVMDVEEFHYLFEGEPVNNSVMTHWAEIEGPDDD